MKKMYFYACLLSSVMFLGACTSDEDLTTTNDVKTNANTNAHTNKEATVVQDNLTGLTKIAIPEGITTVNVYNWADNEFLGTATVENGHIWLGSTNASMTVKLYDAAKQQSSTRAMRKETVSNLDLGYIMDATVYKSEDGVMTITAAENVNSGYSSEDFLSIFPAGKDNRNISAPANSINFSHEAVYTSEGKPFSIYPIYSCGWYDLTLGIFYYDENYERHDVDFWSMQQVGWKPSYQYLSDNKVSDPAKFTFSKTEDAQGYQITLPEHYVYGFYVKCNDNAQAGKYFSYSAENSCKEKHAVNIIDEKGINYVAFEDQDKGDWDINDLICYVNPKLDIIPDVTPEKIKEETEKIPSVIVVPDDVDKIVHGATDDSTDVEARYDGKGHDYVRISIPLKNDEEIQIDLSLLNEYCEADDFRIVAAGDETVVYCADNSSEEVDFSNSHITVNNGCAEKNYGKVTAYVTGKDGKNDEDGKYEAKIALYPKDEESFNQIVKYIENREWDKLFAIVKTKK